jgi:uncharacterized membrane protein YjgN (DUF898 family)
MEGERDYSGYSISDLLNEKVRVDRERYPERAQRIEEAITRRSQAILQAKEPAPALPELSLEFRGSAHEYFRVWIVNLCLTLLTLGIFSAWAKVRKKRYLYSHTLLDGTPFQYLGQPIPILKGRLVAAVGFFAYYAASHFVTSALPYVLGAGVVLAPWLLIRSAAFNARYSAFRNMTFHFDGSYLEAAKRLYVWGLIPAAVIALIFVSTERLLVLLAAYAAFAVSYPWWIRGLKKLIIDRTSFGGAHGQLDATGGQFFRIYCFAAVMVVLVIFAIGLLTFILASAEHVMLPATVTMYAGYLVALAYVQTHITNLVWGRTRLGPVRFQPSLRDRDVVSLYFTNLLAIVGSAGLATPWAVMRTVRYRIEHTQVLLDGDLNHFQGSDRSAVAAIGAESWDFFDLDVSL